MNTYRLLNQKKGISPIIATLLLILIAIAAGVIVYAYVVGFIGASTSNSGGTTNTLSVDQVAMSSKSANFPVTAYVRNEGPTTEAFNTGFFVKGSSLNDQLGPAVSLSVTGSNTLSITSGFLFINETSSTSVTVSTNASALTCTASATLTVSAFGASTTVSCTGSPQALSAVLTLTGGSVSTSPALGSASGSITVPSGKSAIIGTLVSAGTITVGVNNVFDFTLAPQGYQSSNPLSAGSTYTVQVTGTDGASTTASAKAN